MSHRAQPFSSSACLSPARLLLPLCLLGAMACSPSAPAPVAGPPAQSATAQPAATQQETLGRALELLRAGPGQNPAAALDLLEHSNDSRARLSAVQALRLLNRPGEAVATANRLILMSPRLPDAFVLRGLALADLGHEERASEDFAAALVLDPANYAALLAQGDLFFTRELPAEAEASYSRAIDAAPGNPLGWINRGVARDEQGRFDEAIADYTRALALDPASASAYANRGVSRSQTGDIPGMCNDYVQACALRDCARLGEAQAMGYCPGQQPPKHP